MPGNNKFKVSELWDGVKKSTADAWNEASQGAANLLKQIQDLVSKHLPQIAIILRIVVTIPVLLGNARELIKDLGKVFNSGLNLITSTLGKITGTIGKLISNSAATVIKAGNSQLKNAEKNLRSAFNAAVKPLPKAIQDRVKGVVKPPIDAVKGAVKDGFRLVGKIPEKITGAVNILDKKILAAREYAFREAAKLKGKAVAEVNKGILSAKEELFRGYTKVQGKISNELGKATKLIDTVKIEAKNAGKQAGTAVAEVKQIPQKLAKTRAEIVAELNKAVGKAETTIVKGAQSKIDEVGKVASKSGAVIDGVGKQIGKTLPVLEAMAKQFPKLFNYLDDVLKLLGTVFKTVTAMLPLIEGITEQLQFEEIFQRLERIETRIDDNIWADLLENRVRMITLDKKLDRLLGAPGSSTDLQPIVQKLDRIIAATGSPKSGTDNAALALQLQGLRSDIGAIPGKIQPANTTAIAEAVAAKIPKAQTDNAAIATAVAAKIPKPMDSAILTKTIQEALKATPPGQTVSSEAIAAAVAAKIPKPAAAAEIATVVKEKLGPQFKTIDAKLPDNGIFRVDNTAIANAVSTKLEKEKVTVEPSNAAILKAINGIPGITKEQTAIVTKAIRDSKTPDKVELDRLNQVVNLVNTHTTNNTKNIVNSVQNITVKSSPAIVNVPATDLSPIEAKLKDISNAIGVDGLKAGTPINAEAMVKQAGLQQFNQGQIQGVTTLAGMMAAVAAPQFFRSGSHRLGGTFDQSVMDPKSKKVKIEDAMAFQQWQFNQIDERMGMPTQMQLKDASGRIQPHTYRSIQDTVEEVSVTTVSALQDIEVVERYIVGLTQDVQKLMQICLQTREDVDVLIDDSGCKVKEVKRTHPTHIKLTAPGVASSLSNIFQGGEVHYVARQWDDSADKNQKLERVSYDTQIAAMSNKFEFDKAAPELPLQKARAADKPRNDEVWRTYVSTMEEPPEGYISKGNPIPDIKEIKNGNPTNVPKPTNPAKKLGK
jgi:hypothetical protein